jgi:hypothetical protein
VLRFGESLQVPELPGFHGALAFLAALPFRGALAFGESIGLGDSLGFPELPRFRAALAFRGAPGVGELLGFGDAPRFRASSLQFRNQRADLGAGAGRERPQWSRLGP